MNGEPFIQTIQPVNFSKDEEVDQLLADEADDTDFDDDIDDPNEFRIHDPLPDYREYKRKLLEVHKMVHDSEIDLNPPYQREVVWHEDKQAQLIESIFRNYTIPQVVFAVRRDEDGESRVCVDGKQRLTSIVQFFDGLISYKDPRTKKKFWYTTPEKFRGVRLLIPQKWKEYFCNKTITISEYDCITPLQERDVFQRVQLGVPLKPAQKLRAISSPWVEWISLLEEKHIAIEGGLATKINFDTSNARDFQNIAGMIFSCYHVNDEPAPLTTPLSKWLTTQKDRPSEQFKNEMEDVLRAMWVIGSDNNYNEGFVKIDKKVAPIEFIFIGVLVYMLRNESRKVQGRAIYILRTAIRASFKDVKNNNETSKMCWKFVNKLVQNPTVWLTKVQESPGSKRKRNGAQDESDGDDDFAPSQNRKKTKTRGR